MDNQLGSKMFWGSGATAWLGALTIFVCIGCQDPYASDKPQEKREIIVGKTTDDIGEFDAEKDGGNVEEEKDPKLNPLNPLASLRGYSAAIQKISKLQIQQALAFFQAEHGRFPKDYDEFMTKVIKQNNIELPVLPRSLKYQYDVQNHELVVVRVNDDAKE